MEVVALYQLDLILAGVLYVEVLSSSNLESDPMSLDFVHYLALRSHH